MNSFAGIFWLVLAQLQNQFFVKHLPVAAYMCCLYALLERNRMKEMKYCVFIVLSLIFFCGIARFSRGKKNKLRTFQPQKWQKIKHSQPQTRFTGSSKKKCKRYCFGGIFFQKSKDSIQGVLYYWKVICYCQNLPKQPSTGAQKAFK